MALERQITIEVNFGDALDSKIEDFLKNNEIDPAALQIVVDRDGGKKKAHLIYAERKDLKEVYEKQGRTYSDLDAVTFCHTKDIFVPRGTNLDNEVNNFVSNKDIAVISISNYVTPVNTGAVVLYIDTIEQKEKMEAKQAEIMKMQEEMAQKLASQAVKDVDLGTNETIEKYAEKSDDMPEQIEKNTDEQQEIRTAGLMQVEGQVKEPEATVTTVMSESEQDIVVDAGKKKRFGRK